MRPTAFVFAVPALALAITLISGCGPGMPAASQTPEFRWMASDPLLAPLDRDGDHFYSVKDPTVVRHNDRWHVFCTIRGQVRSHQIEYFSFEDWNDTSRAQRHILKLTDGYFCAPQIFSFVPHKKWYLIYQVIDKARKPALQPAYSTTRDIADLKSWTAPALLYSEQPENVTGWIDFWIICDDSKAHLFFTSLDGKMLRAETALADFPGGWGRPEVVLTADIFEASHTYRLKGQNRYLTVVEAQGSGGRRYYKAYVANRLDGAWNPASDIAPHMFATPENVTFRGEGWTDSFSHGELLRDGHDQTLTVDRSNLRFLFQGVRDEDRNGKPYGEIPWRLGLLTPAR